MGDGEVGEDVDIGGGLEDFDEALVGGNVVMVGKVSMASLGMSVIPLRRNDK
jgi:hypothetical protein